jgi:hypothetical protein
MLPLSIITLLLAFVALGLSTVGGVGAGAMFFAAGFLVIAGVAMAHGLRERTPTVF